LVGHTTKHMKHGHSCDTEIWWPVAENVAPGLHPRATFSTLASSYFNVHSLLCIICIMRTNDHASSVLLHDQPLKYDFKLIFNFHQNSDERRSTPFARWHYNNIWLRHLFACYLSVFSALMLSVGRQEGQPVYKNWLVGCWHGYLSGAMCRLADATATLSVVSVKSRLVLPFWYRLTRVVPEKGPLNWCVCVCYLSFIFCDFDTVAFLIITIVNTPQANAQSARLACNDEWSRDRTLL